MLKSKFYTCLVLICLITSAKSFAIEQMPTPIQDQLSNSILFASENWELDDDKKAQTNNYDSKNPKEHKSAVKAALYSALLPGLGEHYVGNRTKAKVFFATEAVTWLSYIAMHSYGNWKKDDMIRLAADKAGASLEGKDDEFNDWVGFYSSSEEFNSLGRVSDPDRVFLNSTDEYWQWASVDEREDYRSFKNSSRTAFRRADFMIVAAIANRIVSVIDALRDANRHNKNEKFDISQKKSYNYNFAIDPLSSHKQFSITLLTPF